MPIVQTSLQLPSEAGNTGKQISMASMPSGRVREILCIGDPAVDAAVASLLALGSAYAFPVAILDGSGNQVTSFGGGGGSTTVTPATSGGLALPTHIVTTGVNNEKAVVKASAGQLYRVSIFNGENYPIFVKFHNSAGTPTPGAGVVLTLGVQAGTFRDFHAADLGIAFSTGIGVTVTKLVADADTTQVGTNSVIDIYDK